MLTALLGNCLILGLFWKFERLHSPSNIFVASLCLCDAVNSLALHPLSIAKRLLFYESTFSCPVKVAFEYFCLFCVGFSVLNIVLISIDRCVAIMRPFHYQKLAKTPFYLKLAISFWFLWMALPAIACLDLLPLRKCYIIIFAFLISLFTVVMFSYCLIIRIMLRQRQRINKIHNILQRRSKTLSSETSGVFYSGNLRQSVTWSRSSENGEAGKWGLSKTSADADQESSPGETSDCQITSLTEAAEREPDNSFQRGDLGAKDTGQCVRSIFVVRTEDFTNSPEADVYQSEEKMKNTKARPRVTKEHFAIQIPTVRLAEPKLDPSKQTEKIVLKGEKRLGLLSKETSPKVTQEHFAITSLPFSFEAREKTEQNLTIRLAELEPGPTKQTGNICLKGSKGHNIYQEPSVECCELNAETSNQTGKDPLSVSDTKGRPTSNVSCIDSSQDKSNEQEKNLLRVSDPKQHLHQTSSAVDSDLNAQKSNQLGSNLLNVSDARQDLRDIGSVGCDRPVPGKSRRLSKTSQNASLVLQSISNRSSVVSFLGTTGKSGQEADFGCNDSSRRPSFMSGDARSSVFKSTRDIAAAFVRRSVGMHPGQRNGTNTVFLEITLLLVCYLPKTILFLLKGQSILPIHLCNVEIWTDTLMLVNAAINPFIYSFRSKDFKHCIERLLKRKEDTWDIKERLKRRNTIY